MTLDFSKGGAFIVNMEDYLKEILNELPEDMNGTTTTPAADHLFKVRDNTLKLNEERADSFYRVVAQLLFVVQRGQLDLRKVFFLPRESRRLTRMLTRN